jgi:hypothetical protein
MHGINNLKRKINYLLKTISDRPNRISRNMQQCPTYLTHFYDFLHASIFRALSLECNKTRPHSATKQGHTVQQNKATQCNKTRPHSATQGHTVHHDTLPLRRAYQFCAVLPPLISCTYPLLSWTLSTRPFIIYVSMSLCILTYLFTYLLHGAESFLRN